MDLNKEVSLLSLLCSYKPTGINRHFIMIHILHKLKLMDCSLKSSEVWSYLNGKYNMSHLDQKVSSTEQSAPENPFLN
jgi:hypothetical protein